MAMSNKSVSIDPANAGKDKTKPEVELVTKWQTITPVWKYFGLEANKKGKPRSPDRHMCQWEVAAKDGNTSNLYSHLKNRHHDLYLPVERKRPSTRKHDRPAGQPSLSEVWQRMQTLPPSSQEHKELTKALTYFLTKNMLPISTTCSNNKQLFVHMADALIFTLISCDNY